MCKMNSIFLSIVIENRFFFIILRQRFRAYSSLALAIWGSLYPASLENPWRQEKVSHEYFLLCIDSPCPPL